MNFLNSLLHDPNVKLQDIPDDDKVKVGHIYATKFSDDNLYYRCKVMHIAPWRRTFIAQVLPHRKTWN